METSWETRGDIVIFQPINTNSKPQNIYSDFHVRYRSEELARSLLMSSNRFSGQSMISALAEFFIVYITKTVAHFFLSSCFSQVYYIRTLVSLVPAYWNCISSYHYGFVAITRS